MKYIFTKIILASLLFSFMNMQLFAQKDTTELEIGKKKLIIIDKKTQQENAIYNLEKGKETFEQEIKNAEKRIAEQKLLLDVAELRLQKIIDSMALNTLIRENVGNTSYIIKITKKDTIKGNFDDNMKRGFNKQEKLTKEQKEKFFLTQEKILARQKKEFENQKTEIARLKAVIEVNKKKKLAFESGILEIEKGIKEIESGLVDIDTELKNLSSNGQYKTSFDVQIKPKRFNAHWAGFEFGLLNFFNKNQSFANNEESSFMKINPEKTFSYGLNIFEYNIPITRHSFGIATGAGIRWNSINLEKNINLIEDENGIIIGELIDANIEELKKNKLNIGYIKVPIIVEYQVPIKRRKLYFGAGIFGELRGWSKQRQVYIINGVKQKGKKVDDFQLSPFRYGISARAGYGDIGIFVEYVLVPLFKEQRGPELYPVMLGLRFIDF